MCVPEDKTSIAIAMGKGKVEVTNMAERGLASYINRFVDRRVLEGTTNKRLVSLLRLLMGLEK